MMRYHQGYEMGWIEMSSKYPGRCEACGFGIEKYDPIFWNKVTKKVRHYKCLDHEFHETFKQKQYWKGGYH